MTRTPTLPAGLLSGPTSRRDLFRIGGLTLAAGAFLVACGGDQDPVAHTGGTLAPEPNAFDPSQSPATLVRTLASIEQLAAVTYESILAEDWLGEAELTEAFTLFREHHVEHVGQLADVARDVGGQPYEEPNAYLQATIVDPAVIGIQESVGDEEAEIEGTGPRNRSLDLAYSLENLLLQTYVRATGMLPEPAQRQTAMSMGATAGRHVAVILTAEDQPIPFALVPLGAAAPRDATIDESGPVATPPTTLAPEPAEGE